MSSFMLLMRGSQTAFNEMSDADQRKVISEHVAWSQKLDEQGILIGGDGCSNMTTQLTMQDGELQMIDRPYRNSEQEVSGFYVIEAEHFEQAVEIAKQCPALNQNESVEVIPLGH